MTPEEINAVIAGVCGFTVEQVTVCGWQDVTIKRHGKEVATIPDYFNDLNAIQSAIMSMGFGDSDEIAFIVALEEVSNPKGNDPFAVVCATAPQRSEALLRVLGKWKEPTTEQKGEM